jgi:hypothetical protein
MICTWYSRWVRQPVLHRCFRFADWFQRPEEDRGAGTGFRIVNGLGLTAANVGDELFTKLVLPEGMPILRQIGVDDWRVRFQR